MVRGIIPKCPGQKLNICSRGGVISLSGSSILSQCVCCGSDDEEETLSASSEESQRCAIFLEDFGRSNAPVEEKAVVQAEVKRELKRFVILKKIPRDYKKQLEILKVNFASLFLQIF